MKVFSLRVYIKRSHKSVTGNTALRTGYSLHCSIRGAEEPVVTSSPSAKESLDYKQRLRFVLRPPPPPQTTLNPPQQLFSQVEG